MALFDCKAGTEEDSQSTEGEEQDMGERVKLIHMNEPIKIKDISKIQEIYNAIKSLDSEIIELEKLGMMVASEKTKSTVSISVENLSPIKKTKDDILDVDGSLKTNKQEVPGLFSLVWGFGEPSSKNENKVLSQFNTCMNESETMLLIGTIISFKNEMRKRLLAKLQAYGIKIG